MSHFVLRMMWIMMVLWIIFGDAQSNLGMTDSLPPISCRVNLGKLFHMNDSSTKVSSHYKVHTCENCFSLLYELTTDNDNNSSSSSSSSVIIDKQSVSLDTQNRSSIEYVCSRISTGTYGTQSCVSNVLKCCRAAEQCCMKQLTQWTSRGSSKNNAPDPAAPSLHCPTTWDGINCIESVPAGSVAKALCPTYVPNFNGLNRAIKVCNETGNWEVENGNEPTIYTNCFPIKEEIPICYASIASLSVSILFLIVSASLFLSFKSLRKQKRIQIHINLFIALLLKSLFELTSKIVIDLSIYNQFTRSLIPPFHFMLQNGCEWITILMRYFQNCSFCWMLCEAIFLDFLLFHAFRIVSSIKQYMLIGWVIPLIYTSIYVIIRYLLYPNNYSNVKCWVDELYYLEYINRGPNILSLCINVGLLYRIICLIRKLPRQTIEGNDERNNWGYTLKAVLVLVPLFGLHLLLVAIHVPNNSAHFLVYGLIQTVIQYSEGTAVSLAFCVFNQEVRTTITKRVNSASNDLFLPPFNSANQRYSNRSSHRSISSVSRHPNWRISNNSAISNSALPLIERHSRNKHNNTSIPASSPFKTPSNHQNNPLPIDHTTNHRDS